MAWKHPGSPTKKKFKTQFSAGKVMPTVFWDFFGTLCLQPRSRPSDYHLFGLLKDALRGRRFSTDREAVHKWLRDQPKTFFLEGIRKPVGRWTECIAKEGDCVEKLRTSSTPTFVYINWKTRVRIIFD
jgi:hypothetical protein